METIGSAEGGYERVEADLTAERAGLDDREWEVLRLRFVDELTQREIGRRLGVSQMQISRISRAALWKLLNAVRGGERHPAAPPASSEAGCRGSGSSRSTKPSTGPWVPTSAR